MDDPTSQCRSESGWTMYLAQSSYYSYQEGVDGKETNGGGRRPLPDKGYDAEDLSMVSDASSGPPHFHEDDGNNDFVYRNDCYFQYAPASAPAKNGGEKKKKKKKKEMSSEQKQQHDYSCLADTASSPFVVNSFSETDYGASNSQASYNWNPNEVQLQGSDSFQRQYCFLDSSVSQKRDYGHPSVFQGNWE